MAVAANPSAIFVVGLVLVLGSEGDVATDTSFEPPGVISATVILAMWSAASVGGPVVGA